MSEDIPVWFENKIHELSNDGLRKSALLEIRSVVSNLDKEIVAQLGKTQSLNAIFDCLNTSDAEEIELTNRIIIHLLDHVKGADQLNLYGPLLLRALKHPSDHVKCTMLKLLEKCSDDESLLLLSSKYGEVLVETSVCLAAPDRSTAQGAITLFTKISQKKKGLPVLFSGVILESLKKAMASSDTARFRVYEIAVSASVYSPEGLQTSHDSGILPSLLTELKSDDHLIQLNALEVLTTLASTNHGLTYLQESGVIQYLVDKILKIEEEPLSFVLLPGLIEFFGNLYKLQPKQFNELYPKVLQLLFKNMESADPVLVGVIIATIGKIGSTNNGKRVLIRHSKEMDLFLKRAGQLLLSKNNTTVTVMNSLNELLRVNDNDTALIDVVKGWFDKIGPNVLEMIHTLALLPFIEIRLSALFLLNGIAKYTWGCERLCDFPGMVEYLLNRTTESQKECKNAKYDIVVSIISCPNISSILSTEILIKLREFVNEGPFYVHTEPEVLIEGAS